MQKKPQQGNKITGRKADASRYIPFNEFLLFDPMYRKMKDKAKTLYSFLRDKTMKIEEKQKAYEAGEEGTRSYLDDEGNIYILADNSELQYILNASEPTVIEMKRILNEYGLLIETPVKDRANRLYVLEPSELSERWAWIDEVKEIRAAKEEKNKAKRAAAKNKKKVEIKQIKQPDPKPETPAVTGDLKNLSHSDLKNLSYGDLKNLSKRYSYKFFKNNSYKKYKITNISPSPSPINIQRDLLSLNIPHRLKVSLKELGKGMSDSEIFAIDTFYTKSTMIQPDCRLEDYKFLNDVEFCDMVETMLLKVEKPIRNMKGLLLSWAKERTVQKRSDFFDLQAEMNAEEQPAADMSDSGMKEHNGFYFK